MATVIIASAKANKASKTTFIGTTFGELKTNPEFVAIYGDGSNVEVIVKPGNVTLRGDDSVLPSGDFSVFIVPTKNKAGYSGMVEDFMSDIEEDVEEFLEYQLEQLKDAFRAKIQELKNQRVFETEDQELLDALDEANNL